MKLFKRNWLYQIEKTLEANGPYPKRVTWQFMINPVAVIELVVIAQVAAFVFKHLL